MKREEKRRVEEMREGGEEIRGNEEREKERKTGGERGNTGGE